MPPSYGSLVYWNDRFTREDNFEWLLPTSRTLDLVAERLSCLSNEENRRILHIGCGNSDLSHSLASLLDQGGEVANVDFSSTVIDAARKKSEATLLHRRSGTGRSGAKTKWVAADLLSLQDLQARNLIDDPADVNGDENAGGYDLILDKSTSDSIACGDDVPITLPYPFKPFTMDPKPSRNEVLDTEQETQVHPLHLLAVHLALLAPSPGARWLCISYSPDRFAFLGRNVDDLSAEVSGPGFPDPRTLWRIEDKWPVDLCPAEGAGKRPNEVVHRPPEQCWVYVLVRTDRGVAWR